MEKRMVEACKRRILEFPLATDAREVAKELKREGWYAAHTSVDGDLRRQKPRVFALLPNSLSLISSGVAILNARPALGFYKIFYNPSLKMGAARQTESDAPAPC